MVFPKNVTVDFLTHFTSTLCCRHLKMANTIKPDNILYVDSIDNERPVTNIIGL